MPSKFKSVRHRTRTNNMSVKKLNKKVNKIISNVEIKEHYGFSDLALRGASNFTFTLNAMQLGTANGKRIGSKVKMKNIMTNIILTQNALVKNGTDTSVAWTLAWIATQVRVLLVLNRQNNNTMPLPMTELFKRAATNQQIMGSVYNQDFVGKGKKLKVLFDKYYDINNLSAPQFTNIRIFKQVNIVTNYSTDNGDATDIIDNDLRLVFIFQNGAVDMSFDSVLTYTDS